MLKVLGFWPGGRTIRRTSPFGDVFGSESACSKHLFETTDSGGGKYDDARYRYVVAGEF